MNPQLKAIGMMVGGAALVVGGFVILFALGHVWGLGLVLFGAIAIGLGLAQRKQTDWREVSGADAAAAAAAIRVPREQLAAKLQETPRPFWVCTNCSVLFAEGDCGGVCLECDRELETHHIVTEADVSMAVALVS